jgi:hypothetical protein
MTIHYRIGAIVLLIPLSPFLLWVYCGHLADKAGQRRRRS